MMLKRAVVTGATGFLGGWLVRELLSNNIMVYGVGTQTENMQEFLSDENFIPVIATFETYKDLPHIIMEKNIDIFYHFAWEGGFTSALRDYKLQMKNAVYAADTVLIAKEMQCKKYVYAGTYNQFEIQNFLSSETFEPRYTCIYSTGKTAASLLCRTLAFNIGIEYSAGLIPMPYGKYNYSRQLANIVLDSLNKGKAPKLVEGNNMYDLVYVGDIAKAFVAIGKKGRDQKEYYVGHRKLKTFREWMIEIRDIIAPYTDLKFGEFEDYQKIDYSTIDLEALYKDTGFECTAEFRSTILEAAEWVKQLGWQ